MKAVAGVLTGLGLFLAAAPDAGAQFVGARFGGVGFQYHSGRLTVGGFFGGYSAGGFYGGPFAPYPWPGYGFVQNNVSVNVITPTVVVPVPPPEPVYDVTGVDLDRYSPPERIGPEGREPPRPVPEVEREEPKLPKGKDVSVPRQPVRPDEKPGPGAPEPKFPGARPQLPKPPEPPKDPKERARFEIVLGKAAFRNKEYGLAAQRFRLATAADAGNWEAFFWLAQARFALGHYADAVAAVHAGMDVKRDWPEIPLTLRRNVYQGLEDQLDRHFDRLKLAAAGNPDNTSLTFLSAHQHWFDGQRAEATTLFREARRLTLNTRYIDRFLGAAAPGVVVRR